jgi:hypothetical protein
MRLHQPRVLDAIIRRLDPHIPPGFLHDDTQDDADVNAGFGRHTLNGGLDEADLGV